MQLLTMAEICTDQRYATTTMTTADAKIENRFRNVQSVEKYEN